MDGILLIDKEKGWTSRDVCNKAQHLIGTSKIGHIGTLDPFATGLLVLTIGKATKAGRFIEDSNKTYIADLTLGIKKSTGDCNGEVIETKNIPELSINDIEAVLNGFIGEIEQIPPMTSAIHHHGVKLYVLAHQGIEVERKARSVFVNSIKLISFVDGVIRFECNVSKGTYIRVLGEDIAAKLNTVGFLSSLRRTAIGELKVEDAKKISMISATDIAPTYYALRDMNKIVCDEILVKKAKSGVDLFFDVPYEQILLIDDKENLISVYRKDHDNIFKCVRGLF